MTSILAVVSVLLVALAGAANSAPMMSGAVQGQAFMDTDSLQLTYSTSQQRDKLLQKILARWMAVLIQNNAQDASIKFVKEMGGSAAGTKQVIYRITAQGSQPIDVKTVEGAVYQNLSDFPIDGVQKLSDDQQQAWDSSPDNVDSNGQSGATAMAGQGGSSSVFLDTDAVVMIYTTSQQRDSMLQQIFTQWNTILTQNGAQNAAIKLVKESPGATAGSKQVVYRITAQSSQPIDVKMVEGAVHQSLFETSKINGVFKLSAAQQQTFDSSKDNMDSNGQSGATSFSGDNGSMTMGGSDSSSSSQGQSFMDTDSLLLTYSTSQQRDKLLQKILAKWLVVLTKNHAQDGAIKFVKEMPGSSSGNKQVVYRITATSSQPIDIKTVEGAVYRSLLGSGKISGVQKLTSAQQQAWDASPDNTDSNGQSGATALTAQSDSDSSSQGFLDTDSVVMTYSSSQQRDQLLQQILDQWTTVLAQSQAQNTAITFVKEMPGSSSGNKQVIYRITADLSTSQPIDVKAIEGAVHQSMFETSPISGVQKLTAAQQQKFDTSSDNLDMNGQSGATAFTGQAGSDSGSSGMGQSFMDTDNLLLTYSTSQQRDKMLQQILARWMTVLIQNQAQDASIKLVKEMPGTSAGTKQVVYRIMASSSQPIDVKMVEGKVHQNLFGNSKIKGVQKLSMQQQQAWDASSDNTDSNGQSGATALSTGSDSDSGSQGFLDTDSALLTYSNKQQRDDLLQQILTKWQTALMAQLQAQNAAITFVKEMPGSSSGNKQVIYRVTADVPSSQPIDIKAVEGAVHQDMFATAPIDGVQKLSSAQQQKFDASSDNIDSNGQSGATALTGKSGSMPQGGSDSGSSSQGQGFMDTDSVLLTYSTSQQRDMLLKQILARWMTVLIQNGATDASIKLVKEMGGSSAKQVVYRIMASSSQPIDIKMIEGKVYQNMFGNSKIKGVQKLSADQQQAWDASPDNTDSNGQSGATAMSTGSDNGSQGFLDTDSALLTYSNNQQRSDMLQQIMAKWQTALMDQYQAQNVAITFVKEMPGSSSDNKQVIYRITADVPSSQPLDIKAVEGAVHQDMFETAPIDGVQKLSSAQQQKFDASSDNIDSNGQSGATAFAGKNGSGSQDGSSMQGQSFMDTDSLVLTYSASQQRDKLLQQILARWMTVLIQNGATDASIKFMKEMPGTASGTKQVVYRITATGSQPIDVKTVEGTVHQNMFGNAKIKGVDRLPAAQQQAWDSSPDNIDSNGQSGATALTGQGDSSSQSFLDTDCLLLTYSTSQQRDSLLQQILGQWQSVLSDNQAQNAAITFVKELPGSSAGTKQVLYRITAQSSQPIDVKTVEGTVHQNLFGSGKIDGVQKLTAAQQKIFDASSMNIDVNGQSGATAMAGPSGMSASSAMSSDSMSSPTATADVSQMLTLLNAMTVNHDDAVTFMKQMWAIVQGVDASTITAAVDGSNVCFNTSS